MYCGYLSGLSDSSVEVCGGFYRWIVRSSSIAGVETDSVSETAAWMLLIFCRRSAFRRLFDIFSTNISKKTGESRPCSKVIDSSILFDLRATSARLSSALIFIFVFGSYIKGAISLRTVSYGYLSVVP